MEDILKQAATDTITILTQPPSITTPSLQAGDPVRNALLTLATHLKQVEPIPPVVAFEGVYTCHSYTSITPYINSEDESC